MPAEDHPDFFTVYYMNEEKVFEATMLLDNEVATGSSRESGSSFGGDGDVDAKGGAKIPILTSLGYRQKSVSLFASKPQLTSPVLAV